MPKTVQNFISLCDNDNQPNYVGTTFYRALSGNSIQAGLLATLVAKLGLLHLPVVCPSHPIITIYDTLVRDL